MPILTPNYSLKKPLGTENYNVEDQNGNMDIIDTKLKENAEALESHKADNVYQTAGGTATVITLTGVVLENGHPKTFIASANNNGAATTINGKPLYKPNTTSAPSLIAGKAYTVWYNSTSDCFFFKASATGTVTSDKVLAGETYSTEVDTDLVGTMDLSLLTPTNLRKNIVINGITGNLEPRGYANGNYSTSNGTTLTVRGLSFKPKVVVIYSYSSYKQVYDEGGILSDAYYNNSSVFTNNFISIYDDGFSVYIPLPVGTTVYWKAWY